MQGLRARLVELWKFIASPTNSTVRALRSTFESKRAMNVRDLLRRYGKGERDFAGVSLVDSPDLVGIDLRNADLSSSDLTGSCLAKAKLDGSCLRSANLGNAQLFEASLRNADLRNANLIGANLLLTELQGADLTDADVSDVSLAATYSLEGARMPDGTLFDRDTQARLREASVTRARIGLNALAGPEPHS
ncbi:pentapeptide repeat-containing protein [Chloroflexota bacterium]